ncbi:MAG: (2Fe-2S)-binding protein [Casimicrobiaceae bacterium]
MFTRSTDRGAARITVTIDGQPVVANAGDSVAAAMLAAGVGSCRSTPLSGAPRGPFCMMGVCFDCLVIVDGVGSRQGCMTRVRDGMRVETQHGRREIGR